MRIGPRLLSLLLLAPVAACAGGSGPGDMPSPPALAYALPPGAAATYLQGDTVRMELDMGGQVLDVTVDMVSTLDLVYAPAGDGLEVTATYRDLDISATNPMAGTQRGDESQVGGPIVFTIDRTGAGTLVSAPELEGVVGQAVSPGTMAAGFFPRLPGRAVSVGETWADTVTVDDTDDMGSIEGTAIYLFTAVGDTVVDGRTLLKVTFTSEEERLQQSSEGGTDITQDVVGNGVGWYLWDASRNLVVEQSQESRLRGTMEVSVAPMPLGLDMTVVQHLRLVGGA